MLNCTFHFKLLFKNEKNEYISSYTCVSIHISSRPRKLYIKKTKKKLTLFAYGDERWINLKNKVRSEIF